MTPRTRLFGLAALAAAATALPAPAPAAAKTVWLCKPGLKNNPCEPSLKTAFFTPAGKALRTKSVKPDRHRRIDCFYVYPTVSDQKTDFANLKKDPPIRSIALFQAARYTQHCRVFAPMYRQRTVIGLTHGPIVSKRNYGDVRSAWREYLRRYNHGRGVVLIGHSQGTYLLRRLIAKEVDRKPPVRRRLVSALLLGGDVLVKKGRTVGGDFKHIRACRSTKQLGCVVAFSTYNQTPPQDSIFGRTAQKGMQVLCTNPASLRGGSGVLEGIIPTTPFAPGSTIAAGIAILGQKIPSTKAPWVESPSFSGRCSSAAGASVLRVAPRAGAADLTPSPNAAWGLHLADANIALGNLLDLVKSEAAAYRKRR
jgi:hypothetical protein